MTRIRQTQIRGRLGSVRPGSGESSLYGFSHELLTRVTHGDSDSWTGLRVTRHVVGTYGRISTDGNTRDICNVKFNKIRGCVYSIKLSARNC